MARKATIWVPDDLQRDSGIHAPESWSSFSRHCLAEGDSWFSLAALPGGNVLQELVLEHDTLVVSTAYPGDTLKHIVDWRRNVPFVKLLADRRLGRAWDAVLLSAGGNDLIDAALSPKGILRRCSGGEATPEECLDDAGVRTFESYLRANMEEIINLRDGRGSPNRGVPIVMHTYDFPTARPAPALFMNGPGVFGPWLYRAYTEHATPEPLWVPLTDLLINRLADLLCGLDLPGLHVVNTRDSLIRADERAKGDSGDWLNEIHANRDGRKKIARRLSKKLDELLSRA
ncbi:MAG: hypothetical protein ACOY7P_16650 [Pseudomonadota bacterium]